VAKVALEMRFYGPWKGPCFEASIEVSNGITNLPWLASELSNHQSLAHAPVTGVVQW